MVNCNDIIKLFKSGKLLENDITTQWKYFIEEQWVKDLIQSEHPNYNLGYPILGFKYEVGHFLDWHTDDMYDNTNNIVMTGGMVLNNDYGGGIFEFEDGTILDQTPGKVFEMKRDVLHRVTKITKGVRYSLHYKLEKLQTLI